MRQAVEYLASQELGGRYPGTAGDTLASDYILSQLRSLKLKPVVKGKKKTGYYHNFTYGKEVERTTHNIIAVLPGKDKQLRNEYIVIGSHYDHLGLGGKNSGSRRPDTLGVHPGADDNASGDAVVLELAKYFKKARSPRSIIFVFFGAEEQGLIGSKQFLEWMKKDDPRRINLPADKSGIVAMVNLDMVGRMRDKALSVSGTGTSSQFKVVKVQNGQQSWFPSGMGNNYGENGEITADGEYTIYFRPNYNGGEDWFYNCIYVSKNEPEPAEVTVVFAANNKTVERTVTLPHTFKCDFIYENGELDGIIQELYSLEYGGMCHASYVPEATGNAAVTAGKTGDDNRDHYIQIAEAFEGTATVTGYYRKYNVDYDTEEMTYTLTISIKAGSATAVENVQTNQVQGTKILRDGMLLIVRDDKTYTITGQQVK